MSEWTRAMQFFFSLKKKIRIAVCEIVDLVSTDGMNQQYRENIRVARKDPAFPYNWQQPI